MVHNVDQNNVDQNNVDQSKVEQNSDLPHGGRAHFEHLNWSNLKRHNVHFYLNSPGCRRTLNSYSITAVLPFKVQKVGYTLHIKMPQNHNINLYEICVCGKLFRKRISYYSNDSQSFGKAWNVRGDCITHGYC